MLCGSNEKHIFYLKRKNSKKYLKGIANLGYRPTFNQKKILLEVHLFNFSGNLYNKLLSVEFLKFIRKEKKFNNVNQDILHLISSFYYTIYNLKNPERYIELLNNTFTYNNDSNHIIYKMFNINNIFYLKQKITKIQDMYKYLYNNNYYLYYNTPIIL